ncbi:nucleotidyltransferase domain-containing protein [Prevotella sp. AGR2160]|uniref:nucleotidyltransferase domain-containing protein n=1 Tax=Prevotella sp. AGR2160 TaxID=1280674 RepID=UPI00048C27D2|nr:nucleotidyltransferase domain-containing protein [Prevotella sp. AGR2160]
MKRTRIVKQISDAIHQVDPSATAILYGSEARGDARADSDIDVLILIDGDTLNLEKEQRYTTPLYMIEWSTGVPVSPTVMLRKDWEHRPFKTPFYINVKNEGRIL